MIYNRMVAILLCLAGSKQCTSRVFLHVFYHKADTMGVIQAFSCKFSLQFQDNLISRPVYILVLYSWIHYMNCEIGGLECRVSTTEYRTRAHCIHM